MMTRGRLQSDNGNDLMSSGSSAEAMEAMANRHIAKGRFASWSRCCFTKPVAPFPCCMNSWSEGGSPCILDDMQAATQKVESRVAASGKTMKTKTALLLSAMLVACTSTSDVTPAGDGNYTVTTQVRG